MNLELLDAPFPAEDIEWRIQQAGKSGEKIWAKVLAYVTNRAIMKRLDEVCGKAGWRNEYRDIPNNGGVECGISIKVESEWITKWDAAENTQVEAVKGGRSGAMKRAAVQWGIGRYLYNLEEGFATVSTQRVNGYHYARSKEVGTFYWQPPALPAWALPLTVSLKTESAESMREPVEAEHILAEFSDYASKEKDIKKLTEEYKKTWAALNGFPDHQEKCKDVTGIRRAELTQQTQAA
ncbi:MAG: Rad52/Rad22 family DNA repair protein [Atlantibacter hermannii]|uniref:Rad52/Rad22 family DNA repair protein n=1 Tax=Atlantibacter hermannii TaxID=565 RepID=UPI0029007EB9|nr:Rad52/Rad22 family DNA repair protein [Atlantibacter hermannii]MDU1953607.1 Rad52/Rad22 family DNA repair protein [Atlantibacter hermannii]